MAKLISLDTARHARMRISAWIAGDQVTLLRVTPSPQTINDPSQYEFFAGHDGKGRPVWTSDLGASQPLVEWEGHVGHATMTYNPSLKKYLLVITDGWPTIKPMNTFHPGVRPHHRPLEIGHVHGEIWPASLFRQFPVQVHQR